MFKKAKLNNFVFFYLTYITQNVCQIHVHFKFILPIIISACYKFIEIYTEQIILDSFKSVFLFSTEVSQCFK